MSKGLKITLIVIGTLAAAGLLLGGGIALGRTMFNRWGIARFGMMGRLNNNIPQNQKNQRPFQTQPFGMHRGKSDRGGFGMGPGMMGRFNNNYSGTPISLDNAKQAVETYVKNLNNADLFLKEIMLFNNNAYGLIAEKSSGRGALEVLVNPVNQAVTPEFGPNMMWNLKYGSMGCGRGMMGGSAGCALNQPDSQNIPEMTVTPEQARKAAQSYLDKNLAGSLAADDPVAFYGYYTLDYTKDGKPAGMLSVNGYSAQVWLHSWHGSFIEEWEVK